MKRYGNLFPEFASFPNLVAAYKKARKGAVGKLDTQTFSFQLEQELIRLHSELNGGSYRPQPYRYFKILDPKERTISVASFRDRVVHHAIIQIIEPIYERCFIHDSYATRKEKGVHKSVDQAQSFLNSSPWFFKSDIDKYFDSIRHDTLFSLLERKIKDLRLLGIIEAIIRNGGKEGIGLPIGNLTSQFFANVYLNGFDHFVKQTLGFRHYIRYMDDFVLFHSDKAALKSIRPQIAEYLHNELGLRLKPSATFLNKAENGLTFLGRRIFRSVIRLARPNGMRMLKRMRIRQTEFENGEIDEAIFLQSMNSYWAQLEPFDGFRRRLLSNG